jgi:hypothetical protein
MVVGAVLIARLPSSAAHVRGFTALWAVPVSQADASFSIGIRSDELRTTSYRLVVSGAQRVAFHRRVTLRPGQQWLASGSFAGGLPSSTGEELRVALYRDDRPTVVYRRVYVTFGGAGF